MRNNHRNGRQIIAVIVTLLSVVAFTLLIANELVTDELVADEKDRDLYLIFLAISSITIPGLVFWIMSFLLKSSKPIDDSLILQTYPDEFAEEQGPQQLVHFKETQAEPEPENDTETKVWPHDLIYKVEWRVFEKICMGLWNARGYDIEETPYQDKSGIDFYLLKKGTDVRLGAVQCNPSNTEQISVEAAQKLQDVVESQTLKLGILMYSGMLNDSAKEFLNQPQVTIKTQDALEIYKQITELELEQQQYLYDSTIVGDYLTPSCPNCDVKLITRRAKKTGKKFQGCPNFPRCRFTMFLPA